MFNGINQRSGKKGIWRDKMKNESIVVILLILIIGVIGSFMFSIISIQMSGKNYISTKLLQVEENYDFVWKCIEWEDKCNNLELATDRNSQFYVKTGEIDTEKCADKCTIFTLRKIKKGYQQMKLERVFQLINKTTYDKNGSVDFV